MDKKLWTVPVLSLVGGIVWRIVQFIEAELAGIIDMERMIDSEMRTFELINLCAVVIIILIIGIILWCKSLDKKTIAKSVTLLVAYTAIILIYDLLTDHFSYYLRFPFRIYENLASWLFVKLNSALGNQVNGWIYYIYILLPYIYVLLGRKKKQV